MAIYSEIFPWKMVIFHCYVKLPEGIQISQRIPKLKNNTKELREFATDHTIGIDLPKWGLNQPKLRIYHTCTDWSVQKNGKWRKWSSIHSCLFSLQLYVIWGISDEYRIRNRKEISRFFMKNIPKVRSGTPQVSVKSPSRLESCWPVTMKRTKLSFSTSPNIPWKT